MERDKLFFRHVLLHYFDLKKTAAAAHKLLFEAYGNYAPSERTCQVWFQRFKSGDFDVNDKERSGQPKKFEDTDLQALLDENSTQTLQELSAALNVTPMAVSKRLHAMGKIQKEGKWVPHKLTANAIANRLNISISLLARQKKKEFLWLIVTGDEKWIYFNNPKRKKSWVELTSVLRGFRRVLGLEEFTDVQCVIVNLAMPSLAEYRIIEGSSTSPRTDFECLIVSRVCRPSPLPIFLSLPPTRG